MGYNATNRQWEEMEKLFPGGNKSKCHKTDHFPSLHPTETSMNTCSKNYGDKQKQISAVIDFMFEMLTDENETAIIELKKWNLSVYGLCDDEKLDVFISKCVAEYRSKKLRKTVRDVVEILLNGVDKNAD